MRRHEVDRGSGADKIKNESALDGRRRGTIHIPMHHGAENASVAVAVVPMMQLLM